jgi:hypothetical protein
MKVTLVRIPYDTDYQTKDGRFMVNLIGRQVWQVRDTHTKQRWTVYSLRDARTVIAEFLEQEARSS